jgi:PAS domain S-box-containing protein
MAEAMLGINRRELIGQSLARFVVRDDQDTLHRHCQEVLKTGTQHNCEVQLQKHAGAAYWVQLESLAVHEEPGLSTHWRTALLDITERKRAEQEQARLFEDLSRSQQHFQSLFNLTPSAVGISTVAEGRFIDVNEGFSRLTGYTREEVIGRTTFELGMWADPSQRAIVLQELQKQGSLHNREGLLRTKFGEIRSLMVSLHPIQLGSTRCLIYLGHDITDRKRAEEALRESESRFRIMADTAPTLIWMSGLDKLRTYFNQVWLDYTGRTMEQELKNGWTDGVHQEDFDRCRKTYAEAFDRREPFQMEYRLRKADGQYGWVFDKGVPRHFPSGEFSGYIGTCIDMTERKWAETALQASDAFTRAVLNSLSAHVCVLDKEGVIVTTNAPWKEFTKRHVDHAFIFGEVSGNYLDHCRHTTVGDTVTAQAILKGIEDVLTGRELSVIYEYACQVLAEECWFLMRVTPLKDAKGVVISHTDISRRVRMGLALEQQTVLLSEKQKELESLAGKLIEAQEAERKRIARDLHDDFNQRLAALSLELESMERAPIALPELITRQLASVRIQAGMLSDDLHDLAYRLHPSLLEHVGLEVAARDHVAEFAKRTGLSVRFIGREVPKTLSPEVATNLFRVLQESLQNVFKHAQATDVTVRLSGSPKGIGLSVRDNGKGFDFMDRNAGAKGLGLVSMQERTRGLGGLLRIHSLPRNGTKICAWIPNLQEDA